ncbi:MAG: hypothetical protein JSV91_14775 [Phycisphaerales bacterium]|nr:MAG: hypothetical protein JSV91_14775 [Phycisphaerales bacterium]
MVKGLGSGTGSKIAAMAATVGPICLLLGSGCRSSVPIALAERAAPTLRVVHHVGGVHERTIVADDRWYQTFGCRLLVLDRRDGRLVHDVKLGEFGRTGSAVDMALVGDRAWIVLGEDAVIEVAVPANDEPRVVRRVSNEDMGIEPRQLSVVEGRVYVSGKGGVVRVDDGQRVYACEGEAGRVVTGGEGLITTVGRRVHAVADGRYLGTATDLQAMPPEALPGLNDRAELSGGVLLFVRQGQSTAAVGLMTPGVRECDTSHLTVTVHGVVNAVRFFHGRIWIVTEERVTAYTITGGRLGIRATIDIRGARDVDGLEDNYLAVAGTFGRAIYRLQDDERGAGGTTVHLHREPGRLLRAICDGRYVLVECGDGFWQYEMATGSIRPIDQPAEAGSNPEAWKPATAAVTWAGVVTFSEDQASAVIRTEEGEVRYRDPSGRRFHCVASVGGDIWLGHDGGVTALRVARPGSDSRTSAVPKLITLDSLRLPGGVRYLFPLMDGEGAVFVSDRAEVGAAVRSRP